MLYTKQYPAWACCVWRIYNVWLCGVAIPAVQRVSECPLLSVWHAKETGDLGDLSVEDTAERKQAHRDESHSRAAETRRRRKADRTWFQMKFGGEHWCTLYILVYTSMSNSDNSISDTSSWCIHIQVFSVAKTMARSPPRTLQVERRDTESWTHGSWLASCFSPGMAGAPRPCHVLSSTLNTQDDTHNPCA